MTNHLRQARQAFSGTIPLRQTVVARTDAETTPRDRPEASRNEATLDGVHA